MKRSLLIFAVLIAIATAGVQPAAAQNRYILPTTRGLSSVLNLCSLLRSHVQRSLPVNINQALRLTPSTEIFVTLPSSAFSALYSPLQTERMAQVVLLPIPQTPLNGISSGFSDPTLVNYYASLAMHGYAAPLAAQIIPL